MVVMKGAEMLWRTYLQLLLPMGPEVVSVVGVGRAWVAMGQAREMQAQAGMLACGLHYRRYRYRSR